MKGATGFAVGVLTGAAVTILVIRLRQVIAENEDIDDISDKITEHLDELERRASAAARLVGES